MIGSHRPGPIRRLSVVLGLALLAVTAPSAHAGLTFGGCFVDGGIPASRAPSCTAVSTLGPSMVDVALPPDGAQVYATAGPAGATFFSRDATTGALTDAGCLPMEGACTTSPVSGNAVGSLGTLVFSADGLHAYAVSSYAVDAFTRDPATGVLTYAGCIADTSFVARFPADTNCSGNVENGIGLPQDLTLSGDGQQLYVASPNTNSIASIDVDPTTGALSPGQCASAGPSVAGVPGDPVYSCPSTVAQLQEVNAVTLSPDGATLYATAPQDGAIVPFSRSSAAGHPLTPLPCLASSTCPATVPSLARATDSQVSSDGRTVTVGSETGAVTFFARDPSTGGLSFAGCLASQVSPVVNCTPYPTGAAGGEAYLTADGRDVYVTGGVFRPTTILRVYARDTTTGFLAYVGCLRDADNAPAASTGPGGSDASCTPADGLYGIGQLAASADGRFVYGVSGRYGLVGGGGEDPYGALVWFARTPDSVPPVAPPSAPRSAHVAASGSATLSVTCPAGVTAYCHALVSVVAGSSRSARAASTASAVRINEKTSDGRIRVKLKLPASVVRAIRRHRRAAVRVTVTRFNANGTLTRAHRTVRVT